MAGAVGWADAADSLAVGSPGAPSSTRYDDDAPPGTLLHAAAHPMTVSRIGSSAGTCQPRLAIGPISALTSSVDSSTATRSPPRRKLSARNPARPIDR